VAILLLFGRKKSEPAWYGKKKGKIFSILLSDELYNRLDEISREYGISKAQLVRDALIEKLNRLEKTS
jgi:predicted DNA-binding protein